MNRVIFNALALGGGQVKKLIKEPNIWLILLELAETVVIVKI